jgi:hypothetical protein
MIEPDTKRYLSEDYAFCRLWQKIGGKIYADIISGMTHMGSYSFKGNVATQFLPRRCKMILDLHVLDNFLSDEMFLISCLNMHNIYELTTVWGI